MILAAAAAAFVKQANSSNGRNKAICHVQFSTYHKQKEDKSCKSPEKGY